MNVVIVHFNTPELTAATVRSVQKHSPNSKVTILDNSDKRRFPAMDGVCILDNTHGQLIDFDRLLAEFPDKVDTTKNNWGSAKHCKTIDFLWDVFPAGFILLDSDVLLKRDISELVDDSKVFTGEVYQNLSVLNSWIPRVLPYLCWINVPMCRKAGIRYFDGKRNWKLYPGDFTTWYDTGGSFYEDCADKRLKFNSIKVEDYIEHFQGGSYNHHGLNVEEWLLKYRNLYE